MSDVTQIMNSIRNGEDGASESLFIAVYDELHAIAESQISREGSGHTLQTTALVNEAFLRLFAHGEQPTWENRLHFFAAAAEAMRRVLVDHARRKYSQKRGGRNRPVGLVDELPGHAVNLEEVIDVNDALDALAKEYPSKAELVKLRYFAGLTIAQTAELLQISVPTANRHWAFAKAWLFDRINVVSANE